MLFVVGPASCAADDGSALTAARLAAWGDETLAAIDRDYLTPDGYYAETFRASADETPRRPAFMWSCGVHLSALVAAAAYDAERYAARLESRIESLEPYWRVHRGVGGYDVQPRTETPDRFYDDNAWIGLALIEAHRSRRDAFSLARAKAIYQFLLSGKDDRLGGGIYWRENERTTKNACINAPAALLALRLYEHDGNAAHLATGRELARWTTDRLQDPDSGLFWDHATLDGEIDRRQYTYNSALMIRVHVQLYALTGAKEHLDDAARLARAAIDKWVDPRDYSVRDEGRFAHLLLEALLELAAADEDDALADLATRCAAQVRRRLRDDNGRYPKHWDRPPRRSPTEFELLDQASAARTYFIAAEALRRREGKAPAGTPSP